MSTAVKWSNGEEGPPGTPTESSEQISVFETLLFRYSRDDQPLQVSEAGDLARQGRLLRHGDAGGRQEISHDSSAVKVEITGAGDSPSSSINCSMFQVPFSKSKGLVQCVLFHPIRPMLFVATQQNVRVYDLVKQDLVKKLITGAKWISSIAIHPGNQQQPSSIFDHFNERKFYLHLRQFFRLNLKDFTDFFTKFQRVTNSCTFN